MKGSSHHSGSITKILYLGHSGSGKTGSLTSLLAAGYQLRILDTDNLLAPLIAFARRECPDKIDNIDYETRRDKFVATDNGPQVSGTPKAYVECLKLMTKWSDGTVPSEWGSNTVFVIDTLTSFSKCALEWAAGLNRDAKDQRQWYWNAQKAISKNIDMLTSPGFNCNVIVNAHIKYLEDSGVVEGFPASVGSAISPEIAVGFDTVLLADKKGVGATASRIIRTVPTAVINLKNPKPFDLAPEYPLSTGLASIFEKLRAVPSQQ